VQALHPIKDRWFKKGYFLYKYVGIFDATSFAERQQDMHREEFPRVSHEAEGNDGNKRTGLLPYQRNLNKNQDYSTILLISAKKEA